MPRLVATLVTWAFAPDWLTVDEAAFLLGCSRELVLELVDQCCVDAEWRDGQWLIEKQSLSEFQESLFEVIDD